MYQVWYNHFMITTTLASALRQARLASGLTQGQLAQMTDTSRPQINRLERGRQDAGVNTWARALAPFGIRLGVIPKGDNPHAVHELRSRVMHSIIAERARLDPSIIDDARHRVESWRESENPPMSRHWVGLWSDLLAQDDDIIIGRLREDTPVMRDLRQSSPFAGVLCDAERLGIILAFPIPEAVPAE